MRSTRIKKHIISFLDTIRLLTKINIWKTLYFNFHYFPYNIAKQFPVYIYRRSVFYLLKGNISIIAPIRPGMIRLGSHLLGTQDPLYPRTILEISGNIVFHGKAIFGRGCRITVDKDAILTFGKNFVSTGNTHIICKKDIKFGDNCLLSWDILMMDTDFHHILDEQSNILNNPKPILIGNDVWIGCRNTILKGVTIPNNNVISANSTITHSFKEENCIIGGHRKSAEVIKRNIRWEK